MTLSGSLRRRDVPVVALVGRPNTGKSTLFNRLTGTARAVVHPSAGVTRDRLQAETDWGGRRLLILDTGGVGGPTADPLAADVDRQVEAALAEADVAVFVVDAASGPLPDDAVLAERLRRWGRPVLVCANKSESPRRDVYEFYSLGLGEPLRVSALHGEGTGDLMDAVVAELPQALAAPRELGGDRVDPAPALSPGEEESTEPIPVAIVGRPNVGKSTLVNRLLGQERLITSERAGTTRDAVDVPWNDFLLVDTPGLRRPARVEDGIEQLSVARALAAVERASVAVLVLDGTSPVTDQDQRIASFIHERGRGVLLVVNKIDLRTDLDLKAIRARLPFLGYAPALALSARTGRRVERLAPLIADVAAAHRRRIATADLNRVLHEVMAVHTATARNGRPLRLYYATQVAVKPPTFLLFVSSPDGVPGDYVRFLENHLRQVFDFAGTPLRFRFRARPRPVRR